MYDGVGGGSRVILGRPTIKTSSKKILNMSCYPMPQTPIGLLLCTNFVEECYVRIFEMRIALHSTNVGDLIKCTTKNSYLNQTYIRTFM